MRHVVVRRAAVLLGALFLGAALVFAWFASQEPSPPERAAPSQPVAGTGAALFEQHCGSCHIPADLREALGDGGTARRRELELFREEHGDSADDEDRLILESLAGSLGVTAAP
jgi:mono/diheme cytochrome c family protein